MPHSAGGEAALPPGPSVRCRRTVRTVTLGLDGEWLPPTYAPQQHGLLPDGPHRPRVHRALRLIMAAAAVAAGLCLVVGMVALVAETGTDHRTAGASHPAGPGKRSGGHQPTPPPRTGGKQGPAGGPNGVAAPSGVSGPGDHPRMSSGNRFRIGRTIDVYTGSGAAEPGPFDIRKPGTWGLSWSYRCPKGSSGDFVVGETRTWIGLAVTVMESGPAGKGIYWVTGDAGSHSVVVASDCTWRLRLVTPVPSS